MNSLRDRGDPSAAVATGEPRSVTRIGGGSAAYRRIVGRRSSVRLRYTARPLRRRTSNMRLRIAERFSFCYKTRISLTIVYIARRDVPLLPVRYAHRESPGCVEVDGAHYGAPPVGSVARSPCSGMGDACACSTRRRAGCCASTSVRNAGVIASLPKIARRMPDPRRSSFSAEPSTPVPTSACNRL